MFLPLLLFMNNSLPLPGPKSRMRKEEGWSATQPREKADAIAETTTQRSDLRQQPQARES